MEKESKSNMCVHIYILVLLDEADGLGGGTKARKQMNYGDHMKVVIAGATSRTEFQWSG